MRGSRLRPNPYGHPIRIFDSEKPLYVFRHEVLDASFAAAKKVAHIPRELGRFRQTNCEE
jgi:hypothetical protein